MQMRFLGHACVEVCGSKRILIDPYLTGNPAAAAAPGKWRRIFLHGARSGT